MWERRELPAALGLGEAKSGPEAEVEKCSCQESRVLDALYGEDADYNEWKGPD